MGTYTVTMSSDDLLILQKEAGLRVGFQLAGCSGKLIKITTRKEDPAAFNPILSFNRKRLACHFAVWAAGWVSAVKSGLPCVLINLNF